MSAAYPSDRGIAARFTSHAAAKEFGSRIATSAPCAAGAAHRRQNAPSCHQRPLQCSVTISSTSGTRRNRSATARRAATTSRADGNARRTSAIAGSAITASPSQFGARRARAIAACAARVEGRDAALAHSDQTSVSASTDS